MTTKRSPKLSRQQIVAINADLQQHLQESNVDGFYEYQKGWSDESIGRAHGATAIQVASLRKELFGEIKRAYNGVNPLVTAWERIKELERRVTELEDAVTAAGGGNKTNGIHADYQA